MWDFALLNSAAGRALHPCRGRTSSATLVDIHPHVDIDHNRFGRGKIDVQRPAAGDEQNQGEKTRRIFHGVPPSRDQAPPGPSPCNTTSKFLEPPGPFIFTSSRPSSLVNQKSAPACV